MPFIAIAIFISLCVGGGVAAAATPQGHAAVEGASEALLQVQAAFLGYDHSGTDAEVGSSADTDTAVGVHGALRVREDADADAKALDEEMNSQGSLNADGSLKVNIY